MGAQYAVSGELRWQICHQGSRAYVVSHAGSVGAWVLVPDPLCGSHTIALPQAIHAGDNARRDEFVFGFGTTRLQRAAAPAPHASPEAAIPAADTHAKHGAAASNDPKLSTASSLLAEGQHHESELRKACAGMRGWIGASARWPAPAKRHFQRAEQAYRAAVAAAGSDVWSLQPRVLLGQLLMWDAQRSTEAKNELVGVIQAAGNATEVFSVDADQLNSASLCSARYLAAAHYTLIRVLSG